MDLAVDSTMLMLLFLLIIYIDFNNLLLSLKILDNKNLVVHLDVKDTLPLVFGAELLWTQYPSMHHVLFPQLVPS